MTHSSKVAVVIGAGEAGFGRGIVEALSCPSMRFLAVTVGPRGMVRADATVEGSIEAALNQIRDTHGEVSAVIYNSGCAIGKDYIADGSRANWQKVMDVNVLGLMEAAKWVANNVPKGGHFISIGSIAHYMSYVGGVDYCAAKAAANTVMRGLRLEFFDKQDIHTTVIHPGLGQTRFMLNRYEGDAEKAHAHTKGCNLLTPEDLGATVAWIMSQPPHVNIEVIEIKPMDQATHGVMRGVKQF